MLERTRAYLQKPLHGGLAFAGRSLFRAPELCFQGFCKHRPEYARLDPRLAALCHINESAIKLQNQPIDQFRQRFLTLQRSLSLPVRERVVLKKIRIKTKADRDLGITVVRPLTIANELRSAIFYLHGGGFVLGGQDAYLPIVKRLATELHTTLILVDYGLAPEYPYPTALEDCYQAYQWLLLHGHSYDIATDRIAVIGDSAGGNLCVNLCLRLAASRLPQPMFQALIYPWLDLRLESSSCQRYQSGFLLTAPMLQWFRDLYLQAQEDPEDSGVSPALASRLERLPTTLIYAAEFDPLIDEAAAFAARLRRLGVPVEFHKFERLVHGFLGYAAVIRSAAGAVEQICSDLRRQIQLGAT